MVETVSLDTGRVVLLRGEEWKTVAAWSSSGQSLDVRQKPSSNVLTRVRNERRDALARPRAAPSRRRLDSLIGISAVVASPILVKARSSARCTATAAATPSPGQPPKISKLDAMLVDVLAAASPPAWPGWRASAGRWRRASSSSSSSRPSWPAQLAASPDLLEGQRRRDHPAVLRHPRLQPDQRAARPGRTVDWINDVMSALSDCVLAHEGVLVDYIGDELMAMWGAPRSSPTTPRSPAARRWTCSSSCPS